MVQPIGPLMVEHRLIERMISVMKREVDRVGRERKPDPVFIDTAVDFIRNYADRCHHGKEEEILFRDLRKKDLMSDDKRVMEELIAEHIWGRATTRKLVEAKSIYLQGDTKAVETIIECMRQLVEFYPKHIAKEDKTFFKASMKYFSKGEQDAMLNEENEFDREFIHKLYKSIVTQAERL